MDTVTYPDPKTAEFVNRFMIPFRANTQSHANLAGRYGIQYTPTIITLDGEGKEHYRTVGFLPAQEFIPALMLGIGKAYFSQNLIKKALTMLDKLLAEFPGSKVATEANTLKQACLSRGTAK
ncbi:MAG TPA: thioredoxin fold domain-containing protein [Desulfomonilaceae bacterium]|nr:thioredoxin fold domain-containing protein [Desulfomonilaceae bacterium]